MHYALHDIAERYARAPDWHADATTAWLTLGESSVRIARVIRTYLLVWESDDSQPYESADTMFAAISLGQIIVSRSNCAHPLWDARTNTAFRLVHDVMGHYAAHLAGRHADFSWEGECSAYTHHAATMASHAERQALQTEVLGQAAWALVHGHFGPQKVAFLELNP